MADVGGKAQVRLIRSACAVVGCLLAYLGT